MTYSKVEMTHRRFAYFGQYEVTKYRDVSWYDEKNVNSYIFPKKSVLWALRFKGSSGHRYYEYQGGADEFAFINRSTLSYCGWSRGGMIRGMSKNSLYKILKWNKVKGRTKIMTAGKDALIAAVMKMD